MNIKLLIIFLYHSFNDNRVCSDASGFIPEIGGFCFSLYLSQSCAMFISFIDFFFEEPVMFIDCLCFPVFNCIDFLLLLFHSSTCFEFSCSFSSFLKQEPNYCYHHHIQFLVPEDLETLLSFKETHNISSWITTQRVVVSNEIQCYLSPRVTRETRYSIILKGKCS